MILLRIRPRNSAVAASVKVTTAVLQRSAGGERRRNRLVQVQAQIERRNRKGFACAGRGFNRRSPCKGKRKGSSVSATSLIFSLIRGIVCCNALTFSHTFSLQGVHILLSHSGCRKSATGSHALRLDYRLMEEIGQFLRLSSLIWATILSRESKRILPRRNLYLTSMLLRRAFAVPAASGNYRLLDLRKLIWLHRSQFSSAVGKNAL